MKKYSFISLFFLLALALCGTGCSSIDFEYRQDSIQVAVSGNGSENVYPPPNNIWGFAPKNRGADITIFVNSEFNQLTPPPQCRMSKAMTVSAAFANGTMFLKKESFTAVSRIIHKTSQAGQPALTVQTQKYLDSWLKHTFTPHVIKSLDCITLTIQKGKGIDNSFEKFENLQKKAAAWTSDLGPGIISVQLLRADAAQKQITYRLLYYKNMWTAQALVDTIIQNSER